MTFQHLNKPHPIATLPPSPTQTSNSTKPSPTSFPSRPHLNSFFSSTTTHSSSSYTSTNPTQPLGPPPHLPRKYSAGDPYASLQLHPPNHSHRNSHSNSHSHPPTPSQHSIPKTTNTSTSSVDRILSKFFSHKKAENQARLKIKPRIAASPPRMKITKEPAPALFELPPEVSRDKTEIDYLRRIQSQNQKKAQGGADVANRGYESADEE